MKVKRRIEIDGTQGFSSYKEWMSLYCDLETKKPHPNTEIWENDNLVIQINSLGCKGPNVTPTVPIIGCFGASETFGISLAPDSWPSHLQVPDHQVLNAAVEGINMEMALARYQSLSSVVPFAAVVVVLGWHNCCYGKTGEEYWRSILDQFAGDHVLACCTLPTCLTEECRTRGIESLLKTDSGRENYANYFEWNLGSLSNEYFNFWAVMEPNLENVNKVLDGIRDYNQFLKAYCAEKGHVLIDLHSVMQPSSYEEIPKNFFDVCHMRPKAYPIVADAVSKALAPALSTKPSKRQGIIKQLRDLVGGSKEEDIRKNLYPLW